MFGMILKWGSLAIVGLGILFWALFILVLFIPDPHESQEYCFRHEDRRKSQWQEASGVSVVANIRESGTFGRLRGPYTLFVAVRRSDENECEVMIEQVNVRRKGDVRNVYEGMLGPVSFEVDCTNKSQLIGRQTVLLPDVLKPKDGKEIIVELSLSVRKLGETSGRRVSRTFVFTPVVYGNFFSVLTV